MWNHRVWRHTSPVDEPTYQVKETYYNAAGDICACTEEATGAYGYTLDELKVNILRMLDAANGPVLEEEGFVFAKWDESDEEEI